MSTTRTMDPAPVGETATTDLTTVIVNWNTVDLLEECIASVNAEVPEGLGHQIIVVDNASSDGSAEWLRTHHPEVRLIESPENVGFCRANNLALRASDSTFVLLINTDARLSAGALAAMRSHFDREERLAIVGPRLIYGDGTFQRWTGGRSVGLWSMAMFLSGLDRFDKYLPAVRGIYLGHDTPTAFQTGWVSSAVMLIRRAALDDIGLLDESIFVYMDDVDLCHRANAGGWKVWYAADATAVHFMGASTKRVTGKPSPEALRALNRWYVRHHGRRRGLALRALEAIGFGARFAVLRARSLVGPGDGRKGRAHAHLVHFKLSLENIDVS